MCVCVCVCVCVYIFHLTNSLILQVCFNLLQLSLNFTLFFIHSTGNFLSFRKAFPK